MDYFIYIIDAGGREATTEKIENTISKGIKSKSKSIRNAQYFYNRAKREIYFSNNDLYLYSINLLNTKLNHCYIEENSKFSLLLGYLIFCQYRKVANMVLISNSLLF